MKKFRVLLVCVGLFYPTLLSSEPLMRSFADWTVICDQLGTVSGCGVVQRRPIDEDPRELGGIGFMVQEGRPDIIWLEILISPRADPKSFSLWFDERQLQINAPTCGQTRCKAVLSADGRMLQQAIASRKIHVRFKVKGKTGVVRDMAFQTKSLTPALKKLAERAK